MTTKIKLTIAIPTSTMIDGGFYLRRCLDSLWNQTFQDFEIVITDNSEDDEVQEICEYYKGGIRYFRNPIKGMAQNTNEAIRQSQGEIIKIIYMDDFLYKKNALDMVVKHFKEDTEWVVSGCVQVGELGDVSAVHVPYYNELIHTGANTIGSPSVLAIKNDNPLLFDENLTWLLDCNYYRMMYDMYGEPEIITNPLVGIGVHEGQMTKIIPNERKLSEVDYLNKKYA